MISVICFRIIMVEGRDEWVGIYMKPELLLLLLSRISHVRLCATP